MRIGSCILDIIYPRGNICHFCGKHLFFPEINGLCCDCLQEINFIKHYCKICGREINSNDTNICSYCREKNWHFKMARGIAAYRGLLKELILHFKYFNDIDLAVPLGDLLSRYFEYYYGNLAVDCIIPVPLHKKRKEIRGYNQAALLAANLQKNTGTPVLNDCLIRKRESLPLYNLDWKQRKAVIKGVFDLNRSSVSIKGLNVLLLDDIFTSGSTVNEAAKILLNKAGVNNIYVLTLATCSIS